MPERETMTQTMKLTDARQNFSHILNQVFHGKTRVLVEKSGIPVAGIISAHDLERLTRFEQERAEDFAVLDEIGAAFEDIPAADLEREVARALAAARKKLRAERERGTSGA